MSYIPPTDPPTQTIYYGRIMNITIFNLYIYLYIGLCYFFVSRTMREICFLCYFVEVLPITLVPYKYNFFPLYMYVCYCTRVITTSCVVVTNITVHNKAIRDGKYLAPPHASAWKRSLHYNRTFRYFSWRHFSTCSSFYIFNR